MKRSLFVSVFCLLFLMPSVIEASVVDSLYQVALALPDSLPIKKRIRAFEQVVKRNPKFAPAHNQLAWLYIKQGKPATRQRAQHAINRALEIDPDNLDYQLTKGALLWAQGYHQRAVAFYHDLFERYPECADAAHWLGYYYCHQFLDDKDHQEVVSSGSSVGFGTGDFDMGSSNRDPVLSSLESRVRAAGFGKIQFTAEASKNRDLALKYLGKTLELRRDFRDAFYQVGLIHLESGRPERLVAAMQYLLDQQPEDKDALLFCGLGYLVQGLPGRANQYFAQALDLMQADERAVLEDVRLIAPKDTHRELASIETPVSDVWKDTPGHVKFWREQDPLFLTEYNERRLEHYARLAYANLRYSQPRRMIEGWKTNPGQTYIKYGRYRKRLVSGDAYGLTETWIYEGFSLDFRSTPRQGLGGRIFNWRSGYEPPGVQFTLRRPERPMDNSAAIEAGLVSGGNSLQRYFRQQQSYRYLPLDIQKTTDETFKKTPSRYIDPYKKQRYTLPHLITAFQERDSVRLEIAYAVPKRRIKSLVADHVGIVDGIFLFDDDWNEIYRNPKVVTRSARRSSAEHADSLDQTYLNIQHTLYVKPGPYNVVAEVLDRKSWAIGSFRKPHVSTLSSSFAMSDLLLASRITPNEAYPESRQDLDIVPNPLRTFQGAQPMFIYLELYHLKRDTFGRTKYEISYRIGRPKAEEIDPALFFDLDLPEGELEITWVESQPDVDEGVESSRSAEYEVTYTVPKRNLITEWIKKNVRGLFKKHHETTITAQYEGDRTEDFTYLQIDMRNIKPGVHKLTVATRDLNTKAETERSLLFRVVD